MSLASIGAVVMQMMLPPVKTPRVVDVVEVISRGVWSG